MYIKFWRRRIKKTSGTKEGGAIARETNLKRYGEDYYKRIGALGGKACFPTKGFGSHPERAREAGRKGGIASKRGPSKQTLDTLRNYAGDIEQMYENGMPAYKLAKEFGVGLGTLKKFLRGELDIDATKDEIEECEMILEGERERNRDAA